ncbi:MAG: hypothetical protein QOE01_2707 [Actinomycetota bacterium]|nr:hypothetical protein [Actinomycetota bacterium]
MEYPGLTPGSGCMVCGSAGVCPCAKPNYRPSCQVVRRSRFLPVLRGATGGHRLFLAVEETAADRLNVAGQRPRLAALVDRMKVANAHARHGTLELRSMGARIPLTGAHPLVIVGCEVLRGFGAASCYGGSEVWDQPVAGYDAGC